MHNNKDNNNGNNNNNNKEEEETKKKLDVRDKRKIIEQNILKQIGQEK